MDHLEDTHESLGGGGVRTRLTQSAYSLRRARSRREFHVAGRHRLQLRANVAHTVGGRSLAACGLLAGHARRAAALPMNSHRPRIPVGFQ